jgi:hypothetical protein
MTGFTHRVIRVGFVAAECRCGKRDSSHFGFHPSAFIPPLTHIYLSSEALIPESAWSRSHSDWLTYLNERAGLCNAAMVK